MGSLVTARTQNSFREPLLCALQPAVPLFGYLPWIFEKKLSLSLSLKLYSKKPRGPLIAPTLTDARFECTRARPFWSGSCSSTQMASVDVSRTATRGLPALKSALCALAKFALPSPSLLHNPLDWPSMIAEVVQDAFAGLAAGQDEVAKGALSLAVQRLGKLQLVASDDGKVGPTLKSVWKELAAERPPAALIQLKEFRLYLAGLTERFLAQRMHKSTGKSTIKSVAALKSQIQLRTALGLEPEAVESCRLSVREVAALLKDAGVEVPPACAAALVLRLAGGGSPRRPAQRLGGGGAGAEAERRGAGSAAEETLLRYVQVERALVSSLSDAALNQLLSRRRAARGVVEPPAETRPPLPPPAVPSDAPGAAHGVSPERTTCRSWRAEREAARASGRGEESGALGRAAHTHSSSHRGPEQRGDRISHSNPEVLLDGRPHNSRRASRESLGLDSENEFVQYVSLEKRESAARPASSAAVGRASPYAARLQWLQKVQAQAAQAPPARLLGSSDRRDLERAWLGLGEEELAFPLERPWPPERPHTPLPPFEEDAPDAAPTRLPKPHLRLSLPSKSPRSTDFKNMHV